MNLRSDGPGRLKLRAGHIVRVRTSGGGGTGDPLTRDRARLLRDVRLGKMTSEHGESAYGVVIRNGEVDVQATRERRAGHISR